MPDGRPTQVIAWHRDADDELRDTRVAAVELVNLMRPTMAVARYVTFAAVALYRYRNAGREFKPVTRITWSWLNRFFPTVFYL